MTPMGVQKKLNIRLEKMEPSRITLREVGLGGYFLRAHVVYWMLTLKSYRANIIARKD
jgi:hypothetical protein